MGSDWWHVAENSGPSSSTGGNSAMAPNPNKSSLEQPNCHSSMFIPKFTKFVVGLISWLSQLSELRWPCCRIFGPRKPRNKPNDAPPIREPTGALAPHFEEFFVPSPAIRSKNHLIRVWPGSSRIRFVFVNRIHDPILPIISST